jgi:hypothetical protein
MHAEMLRAILDRLPVPQGYDTLRDALNRVQPERAPPKIRQSPENTAPIKRS